MSENEQSPTDATAALGGRYHLRELLGVGGSAAVFRAVDELDELATDVAVKILHPHLCETQEARDSFLSEAARAKELQHPHIAQVMASGLHESGGVTQAWIALELMRGGSLAERVNRLGPLTVADAAAVMASVLEALGAAHAAGFVHRDVSPANIMLRHASRGSAVRAQDVALVDFGLADLAGRHTMGGDVLLVTPGDGVIGNASYLSPEQAQGKPVTAAGDIYQAGAVLYFLVTGMQPYPRDTREQTANAHVNAPPPVPSVTTPTARALDSVVTRAMAKKPEHRFADTDDFRAALAAVMKVPVATSQATQVTRKISSPKTGFVAPALVPGGATGSGESVVPVRRGRGAATLLVVMFLLITGAVIASATLSSPRASVGEDHAAPPTTVTAEQPPTVQPTLAVSEAPQPPTNSSPPSPAKTAVAAPAEVSVPELTGDLSQIQRTLSLAGLSVGTVSRRDSTRTAGHIVEQHPAPGAAVSPGQRVDVVLGSGKNAVPAVAGSDVAAAVAALQAAGFTAAAPGAAAQAVVVSTSPVAGSVVELGSQVSLVTQVSTPSPPASPSASPEALR